MSTIIYADDPAYKARTGGLPVAKPQFQSQLQPLIDQLMGGGAGYASAEADINADTAKTKAAGRSGLISRGLDNTTVLDSANIAADTAGSRSKLAAKANAEQQRIALQTLIAQLTEQARQFDATYSQNQQRIDIAKSGTGFQGFGFASAAPRQSLFADTLGSRDSSNNYSGVFNPSTWGGSWGVGGGSARQAEEDAYAKRIKSGNA